MKYPRLQNILGAAFAVQTGLDQSDAKALYERALAANPELRQEVKAALNDNSVDWVQILNNENDEIYDADGPEDAFQYACRILASNLLE